jgi:hypothetical protein
MYKELKILTTKYFKASDIDTTLTIKIEDKTEFNIVYDKLL